MTETFADHSALVTWSTDQCPFVIEYSRKALDDIRLAVVDAFFSLPRGGAEIGGILLGRLEGNRVQIVDYAPIECEHAFGPAFTLSPADQTKLGDLLRQTYPSGLRPVGWYHSHTRSGISLCEADLDIHNRYFPERWQVALVLRPSTLQPTQAGFFFREPDGSIHAENSYQEFVVEALPLQQLPAAGSGAEALPGTVRETEPEAVVINLSGAANELEQPPQIEAPPEAPQQETHVEPVWNFAPAAELSPTPETEIHSEPEREPEPAPLSFAARAAEAPVAAPIEHASEPLHVEEKHPEPERDPLHAPADESPSFGRFDEVPSFPRAEAEQPRTWRPWMGVAVGLVAGLVLGVVTGQMRAHSRPAAVIPPPPVQAPVRPAPEDAALRKQIDDLQKQIADLTQQNNSLHQENAGLTKQQADLGKQQTDAAKQQGDFAKRQADFAKREAELQQQRDTLAKQAAKLKADLGTQTARAQSLQQQVEDLRRQLQRRRLSIQSSDPLP